MPVVTLPKANGVFVATTPDELELAIKGIWSRIRALLRRWRGLRLCRSQVMYGNGTLF